MEEIDTWRAADQMMKLYGTDAALQAGLRADKLLDQGDVDGFHVWKRVAAAIGDLGRKQPSATETLN